MNFPGPGRASCNRLDLHQPDHLRHAYAPSGVQNRGGPEHGFGNLVLEGSGVRVVIPLLPPLPSAATACNPLPTLVLSLVSAN